MLLPPARRYSSPGRLRQSGKAVIDTEPFTSFERSEVSAHFRSAWRAVLALATGETGELKVSTRTEDGETFICRVRIATPRNTYRFTYLVDGSEADRSFYEHVTEVAEGEGLSGQFNVDPFKQDDAVIVTYSST